MNPHLFVYGSLMSSAGHPMGERLRREARLIGEATIQGTALSGSAGIRAPSTSSDPGERVHGEVYALAQTRPARWHGSTPTRASRRENRDQSEYERVERPVRLASGEEIAAWVYLYRRRRRRAA